MKTIKEQRFVKILFVVFLLAIYNLNVLEAQGSATTCDDQALAIL
jgi:hypothetical protein